MPNAAATLTHFGAWDDSGAGNLLAVGALMTSRAVAVGDIAKITAGSFTLAAY